MGYREVLSLIDIVVLLGGIPRLPTWDPRLPTWDPRLPTWDPRLSTWDPAAFHDIPGRISANAALPHGITHGISRNVAGCHGSPCANYRWKPPWEPTRFRGMPWGQR